MNDTVKIDLFPSANRGELKDRAKTRTLKINEFIRIKLRKNRRHIENIPAKVIWVFKRNRKPVRKVVDKYLHTPETVNKFCSRRSVDRYAVETTGYFSKVYMVEPTDHYNFQDGLIFKAIDL